jgi:GNAT superfamily N-acetyltransferase
VTVVVRRAGPADSEGLAGLFSSMQEHYRGPDPPGGALATARLLTRDGENIPFALIAEHAGRPVGLATLNPLLYSGSYQWLLFLKDLYVVPDARSLGVGAVLMHEVARIGLAGNYARVEWTTDGTNTGAQRLYDRLGARRPDKVNYRLAGEDLKRLAGL